LLFLQLQFYSPHTLDCITCSNFKYPHLNAFQNPPRHTRKNYIYITLSALRFKIPIVIRRFRVLYLPQRATPTTQNRERQAFLMHTESGHSFYFGQDLSSLRKMLLDLGYWLLSAICFKRREAFCNFSFSVAVNSRCSVALIFCFSS